MSLIHAIYVNWILALDHALTTSLGGTTIMTWVAVHSSHMEDVKGMEITSRLYRNVLMLAMLNVLWGFQRSNV
jgi:hypothetical protein